MPPSQVVADVDLPGYFSRIGYVGTNRPTIATLRELVARHLHAIAFESIDPFLGVPVSIDSAAVQGKLIHSRRGGYCHEHNLLFYDVLAGMGFSVTSLGGRVVSAYKDGRAPLTHRLTLVQLAEGSFIADVGLGGRSPPAPLQLEPGLEQVTSHGTYRIARDGDVFEVQQPLNGGWEALYRFTLAPQTKVDFEVANWFTSTHPRSLFTQNLVVCRLVGETRVNLRNSSLSIRHADDEVEKRVLSDADDLGRLLDEVMGLTLPVSPDVIWAKLPK
jgi:N-hydroxyarylamine O-acetyltransferase